VPVLIRPRSPPPIRTLQFETCVASRLDTESDERACEHRYSVTAFATITTTEDGLWREHSWGVRDGEPVEATVARLKYFGIVMTDYRATWFAD
jgi:hypothetical protein